MGTWRLLPLAEGKILALLGNISGRQSVRILDGVFSSRRWESLRFSVVMSGSAAVVRL
jgi:hypothetical protein